jgi:hypothetical protein
VCVDVSRGGGGARGRELLSCSLVTQGGGVECDRRFLNLSNVRLQAFYWDTSCRQTKCCLRTLRI